MCFHEDDFGISAEWHFYATSHGKGACDGVGGSVKRLAARASLQKPYNDQIMTPCQLFDWEFTALPSIHFGYCNTEEYEGIQNSLEQRFRDSRTIPGTRTLHSFVPILRSRVRVHHFSSSATFKEERVTLKTSDLQLDSVVGFVTCLYDEKWWLACVLQIIQEDSQVKPTFLHQHGPSSSYIYLRTLPIKNILDPRSRSGRVYTLSKGETKASSGKLKQQQQNECCL